MKEQQSKRIVEGVRLRLKEEVDSGRKISRIAESAGIERTQLSRFLSGQRSLPTEQWIRLASALDMTVLQLDDETRKPQVEPLKKLKQLAGEFSSDEKTLLLLLLSTSELNYDLAAKKFKSKKLAKAVAKLLDLRLINYL